ncbi:hypothetical protein BOTBODRAFT_172111 [Botryobasidium botryosum FD-172 SS1]|uniref:Uncharacterized protein n=1 Tax=Botryobasidium botryosum (strain FD-172 SS1) TaxID=930990 RepID=A0A067N0H8_BOTB1|nr:hypothetical protein BOTBODRAFT_172111 [Botryobasidium botryosum FD-172 SS1]
MSHVGLASSTTAERPKPVDCTGYPWFQLCLKAAHKAVEDNICASRDQVSQPRYPWFDLYPPFKSSQSNIILSTLENGARLRAIQEGCSEDTPKISQELGCPYAELCAAIKNKEVAPLMAVHEPVRPECSLSAPFHGAAAKTCHRTDYPDIEPCPIPNHFSTRSSTQHLPELAVEPFPAASRELSSLLNISYTDCVIPDYPPPEYTRGSYESEYAYTELSFPFEEALSTRGAAMIAEERERTRQLAQGATSRKVKAKSKGSVRKALRSKRAMAGKCCRTVWGAVVPILDRLGPTEDEVFLH